MLAPRLLFQVLLHVLFEHAVGYALLALKEVEEISLLLPQVGKSSGLAGRKVPSMHRAPPRGRPRALGVHWARKLQSRGSFPAFVIIIALGAFRNNPPQLHPIAKKQNRNLGPMTGSFLKRSVGS